MTNYDFSALTNVELINADLGSMTDEQLSVLNTNAYGARGTYRMKGTHHYKKRDGEWIAVNAPK